MENLTSGELEVMSVLWKHGSMKPAEIQKYFPRPIKNAALRSILLILLEKGHVRREKVGKAFYYTSKTPPQNEFLSRIRRLAKTFFQGSPSNLVAQIIRNEKLSEQDISELKKIVEEKARKLSKGDK
ncbi:BlaI/MecI/CopY family transcriptional regulator [Candidatus Sumerlaeota bacterium]|nr:BlaI/MecI/CopY family transcriptional regulator [Candidatus Sumerlaeota bacterium]